MKSNYPEMKAFAFRFVADIPKAQTQGYSFIQPNDFDLDAAGFTREIGTLYGLTVDVNNRVMYRDLFLMIRPKDLDEKIRAARARANAEKVGLAVDSMRYAPEEDPRRGEFLDDPEAVKAELVEDKPVARRGRPPTARN
jgi:hypothetical protein